MDYMSLHGNNYGVFVDRFTGWPGVYTGSAASDVVTVLSHICEDYGVPLTCTTDGGPPYTSHKVKKMMTTYGIGHRLCSVANPHANLSGKRPSIAHLWVRRPSELSRSKHFVLVTTCPLCLYSDVSNKR